MMLLLLLSSSSSLSIGLLIKLDPRHVQVSHHGHLIPDQRHAKFRGKKAFFPLTRLVMVKVVVVVQGLFHHLPQIGRYLSQDLVLTPRTPIVQGDQQRFVHDGRGVLMIIIIITRVRPDNVLPSHGHDGKRCIRDHVIIIIEEYGRPSYHRTDRVGDLIKRTVSSRGLTRGRGGGGTKVRHDEFQGDHIDRLGWSASPLLLFGEQPVLHVIVVVDGKSLVPTMLPSENGLWGFIHVWEP